MAVGQAEEEGRQQLPPSARPTTAAALRRFAASATLRELSGGLGDLGTFLPLVVALAATTQLDLGTTLLVSGLYNITSGLAFGIPVCVQPMKTICALALAAPGLSPEEVASAGLFVSGVMLLLGATGAMGAFNGLVPGCVVRGIQLAVGLQLATKGVSQALQLGPKVWRPWLGAEGLLVGAAGLAFLLATTLASGAGDGKQQQQQQEQEQEQEEGAERRDCEQPGSARSCGAAADERHDHPLLRRPPEPLGGGEAAVVAGEADAVGGCGGGGGGGVPSALVVVLVGLAVAPIVRPDVLSSLRLGPSIPRLVVPTWDEFKSGALSAGVPQLPLTSLNSVVALSQLAGELFPGRPGDAWRWRPGRVALAIGAMNLAGCWLGAFPCCFGSGGLAAQYKFGARSGTAPILLGLLKVGLALLFGSSLLQLLQGFPQPLLGAMLLVSGVELASSARKQGGGQREFALLLVTATAILALGTWQGFVLGLAAHAAVGGCERAGAAWRAWRHGRQRQQRRRWQRAEAAGAGGHTRRDFQQAVPQRIPPDSCCGGGSL